MKTIEIYTLVTGRIVFLPIEDLRVSLALARLHTNRVSPPTSDESIILDRVEKALNELEME